MIVPHKYSKTELRISWLAQIIASLILVQTLYFKFSGAPESVYIFTKAGIEPWGRYIVGVLELGTSILLVIPTYCWMGALLSVITMTGAILFHLTALGIPVQDDHGYLFTMAIIILVCGCIVLHIRKAQIPFINRNF